MISEKTAYPESNFRTVIDVLFIGLLRDVRILYWKFVVHILERFSASVVSINVDLPLTS